MTIRPITKLLSDVSEDARKLYFRSAENEHTLQLSKWWTPELVPAIEELVSAGLARYDMSHFSGEDHHYLWTIPIAKKYTQAVGRDDGFIVRIRVLDEKSRRVDEGPIIVDFDGAYIDKHVSQSDYVNGPKWRIICRHLNGTDFEHDSMILGDVWLRDVSLNDIMHSGYVTIIGTVSEAHLYEYGQDPFKYETSDYAPREDGSLETCDADYCDEPHPIGPYLAPEVTFLNGKRVAVEFIAKANANV